MQTFVRDGNIRDVGQLQLSYLQLEFWVISVEIFLEKIYKASDVELQQFHQLALGTFNKVFT